MQSRKHLKKGKEKNLCLAVDESFFNSIETKATKLNLDKQSVMAVLLNKWLADEVKI